MLEEELILVGDKILVSPLEEDKTDTGLYLPQNVKEKEKVQSGVVIKVGPGYPVPDPSVLDNEPWVQNRRSKYFPLQAKEGDHCLFLKEQSVEIELERKKYFIVPQSAILILRRKSFTGDKI